AERKQQGAELRWPGAALPLPGLAPRRPGRAHRPRCAARTPRPVGCEGAPRPAPTRRAGWPAWPANACLRPAHHPPQVCRLAEVSRPPARVPWARTSPPADCFALRRATTVRCRARGRAEETTHSLTPRGSRRRQTTLLNV